MAVTALRGAHIVTRDGIVEDGWLTVQDGVIAVIGVGAAPGAAGGTQRVIQGAWVLPGFVDLHVHGGGGASFTTGRAEDAGRAAAFHLRHGTTTMLASLVTAPHVELLAACRSLAPLVADQTIAGIHLEGPYLSHIRCGAQDPRFLRHPNLEQFDELLEAANGTVRQITVAPELPQALELIRHAVAAGVVAAIGHTNATHAETIAGIDAGATLATHLCNAMPALHHRDAGPVLALLDDERVTVELINDEVHIHHALIHRLMKAVGPARVALITDAMAAAGRPDGTYRLGQRAVIVRDGAVRLVESGDLAGSVLTMDVAMANAVRRGTPMRAVVCAAATTPARVLGLADRGAIGISMRADIVVLDESLAVTHVLKAGEVVVSN